MLNERARKVIEIMRWTNGALCVHCDGQNVVVLNNKTKAGRKRREGLYKCRDCGKQFTVTCGSRFERTHLSPWKLLRFLWYLNFDKKQMSIREISKKLNITYKTAWKTANKMIGRYETCVVERVVEVLERRIEEIYGGYKERVEGWRSHFEDCKEEFNMESFVTDPEGLAEYLCDEDHNLIEDLIKKVKTGHRLAKGTQCNPLKHITPKHGERTTPLNMTDGGGETERGKHSGE